MQVVIADDEPLARQLLMRLVRGQPDLTIAGTADNGEQALRLIRDQEPELAFLDIKMPKLGGVELVEALRSLRVQPLIVFVTAFDDYATDAFDLDVLDYLVKPIEKQRFARAVARARRAISMQRVRDLGEKIAAVANDESKDVDETEATVTIRQRDELIRVPERDIYWLEAKSQYVNVHTRDAHYLVAEPLARYYARLQSTDFKRVHRSAVVNATKVERILKKANGVHELRLLNGARVPLSRSRKRLVDNLLSVCVENRRRDRTGT